MLSTKKVHNSFEIYIIVEILGTVVEFNDRLISVRAYTQRVDASGCNTENLGEHVKGIHKLNRVNKW